jgi:hypothetical protein
MITIFLYNKERIVMEGLQLAKLRISKRLGLSENIVEGDFRIDNGELVPNFTIDKRKVPLSKLDDLEMIMKDVWGQTLVVIKDRLDSFEKGAN